MGRQVTAVCLSLGAVELGSTLREAEYFRLEKMVVGGGGLLVMLGALGMELKGSLKALERLVYV